MDVKVCKKCGGTDWTYGQCRSCKNAHERERVRLKYGQHQAACRRWRASHRIEDQQAVKHWMSDPSHRKQVRTVWQARRALRDGRLVRPDHCCICGKECKPQMHHQSYDSPLKIDWVCRGCHVAIHNTVRELVRIAQKNSRMALTG